MPLLSLLATLVASLRGVYDNILILFPCLSRPGLLATSAPFFLHFAHSSLSIVARNRPEITWERKVMSGHGRFTLWKKIRQRNSEVKGEPTCPILSIARPSHENDDYIYLRWPQRPRFLGEREGGKRDRDAALTPSISERSEVGSVRVPRRWLTSLPLLLSHEIDGVRKEKERLTAAKGTRR